jgi:hypothetical protein
MSNVAGSTHEHSPSAVIDRWQPAAWMIHRSVPSARRNESTFFRSGQVGGQAVTA